MRWWRAYTAARHDPKLLRLSDKHFRWWFNLLCVAGDNDGKLPPIADMAAEFRMAPKALEKIVLALVNVGLVDRHGDTYEPHNWSSRQYKSDTSAERMRRHRERQRDVTGDVTVTRSETETETETEKKPAAAPAREDAALAAWQEGAYRHGWRQAEFMTSTRRFRLAAVLDQFGGIEGWGRVLSKAGEAKFFRDDGGAWHGWFSLDWLLDGDHVARLLEGAYAERRSRPATTTEDWNARRIREAKEAVRQ